MQEADGAALWQQGHMMMYERDAQAQAEGGGRRMMKVETSVLQYHVLK